MVSVVQWAIFANSPIFMRPPDSGLEPGLDLVVASRCLLDHKSTQEATMQDASQLEADRREHGNACAREHVGDAHGHAHAPAKDESGGLRRDEKHECDHPQETDGHRGRHGHPPAHRHADAGCCASATAMPVAQSLPRSEAVGADTRTAIRIMQMDGPTEEALIRKKLDRMPDVRSIDFNLMQRVLTVVHTPD